MSDPKPTPETSHPEAEEQAPEAEVEAPQQEAGAPEEAPFEASTESADEPQSEPDQSLEDRIAELEAALQVAQKERLLAVAEADNAGKRADKRISDNAKFATSNICKAILQVADNLERALLAAPEELRAGNDVVKNLAVGVEMTGKELATVLEGQGVKKFESLNHPFDANIHQAMQEVEHTDVPHGTVVQVMQEGYMMADRLLRPAMVIVSKGGPKRQAPAAEAGDENASVDTSA